MKHLKMKANETVKLGTYAQYLNCRKTCGKFTPYL